ncbi:MAG: iron-only hydrogenase system regulator [Spirochaetaceae bacterium]|nr:iron-only hydrogenase system regulator [Spirochaetaceae bacterium]
MQRIAVIGAILEKPQIIQQQFNELVSAHMSIVKGRIGIPFEDDEPAVVSIIVKGGINEINALTGKLGNLAHVTVKTAISSRNIE